MLPYAEPRILMRAGVIASALAQRTQLRSYFDGFFGGVDYRSVWKLRHPNRERFFVAPASRTIGFQ
jgi:hypothetical protein